MTREEAIEELLYMKHIFIAESDADKALDMAIEALEPKTKWILCTDQLPKIRYDVLITVWFHGTRQTKLGYRQRGEWMFWHEGNLESYLDKENKVIAWMPLPEPYKGG